MAACLKQVFSILISICCFCSKFVSATTNITTTTFLTDPETLVSSNAIFKIGFFSPFNSTNRYLGIWYNFEDSGTIEIVWVANRNNPVTDSSGVLKVSDDGNLQVSSNGSNAVFWSSNVSHQANSSTFAQLLDTGNLALISTSTGMIIWQSFEHLTDSLLPQTTILIDKDNVHDKSIVLRSWKSASDPSIGQFTSGLVPNALPEFVIWYDDKVYWRSGPWNGNLFIGVPILLGEASFGFRIIKNDLEGTLEMLFSVTDESLLIYFALNYDGNVVLKNWDEDIQKWKYWWQSIGSECDIYGKCGSYGSCSPKSSPICTCLKGFEPMKLDEWSRGNWSSGCVRRTPLQCGNIGGKVDGFLKLKSIKVPDYAEFSVAIDEDDCMRKCLGNCSCLAYAYPKGIGCMTWNRSLIDLQQIADGYDIFIRLAHSELGETSNLKLVIAIVSSILTATLVLGLLAYYLWRWKCQLYGKKSSPKEKHFISSEKLEFKDLALFEFKKLEFATNNFSVINKLGEGGFGPVYKGKLEDGQEIAVKRLSRASGQGQKEFMNEVLVISKLQHRNLVKLLGCCVEREEKLLVYEYMPNNSLDALLFDLNHRKQLNWTKRFNIINGICRGLLYLHRDSRLKIIHRDLKASNILLDEELNPKISDFGTARIFGTKQDQANTLRVVGTYGYMSPEYAMEGHFSEKSDIYSLGVLLLEIVSGRKNSSFMEYESLGLLTYAWKLWNGNNMISLIDPTISYVCFKDEILKCIHLGLLCVQEFPEDRPTISTLISLLDGHDINELPHPKQPGFTLRQVNCANGFPQNDEAHCTINNLSLTVVTGR